MLLQSRARCLCSCWTSWAWRWRTRDARLLTLTPRLLLAAAGITVYIKQDMSLSLQTLQSRKCAPLVQLLDQLGVTRAEAHRAVLDAAKARLLALVPRLPPDALVALLSVCFPYVGLPELREVPLAVLGQLRPVPPTFLKQLATDKDLFADLPPAVQREVGPRAPPRPLHGLPVCTC